MLNSVYLHGFASSPASAKARHLRQELAQYGDVRVPDLNLPAFTHLSIDRMVRQTSREVAASGDEPVLLLGSSLGGYIAARFIADGGRADALVMLAPALDLADLWSRAVSEADRATWRSTGTWPIEHHAYQRSVPLHYGFYEEVTRLAPFPNAARVPTLIVHGSGDKVVPLSLSEEYVRRHPSTQLVVLRTDHQMSNMGGDIWKAVHTFLQEKTDLIRQD